MAQQETVEVAVSGSIGTIPWAWVTNYTARFTDPALSVAAIDALATAVYTNFKLLINPMVTSQMMNKLYRAKSWGTTVTVALPAPHVEIPTVLSGPPHVVADPGAIATDWLPSFNAVPWLNKTASGLRRYRSNQHVPGVVEADTLGQSLTAGAKVAWQAAATALMTVPYVVTVGASTWTFYAGVFTKKYVILNGPGSTPWSYTSDILSATVKGPVGVMTRRKYYA